MNTERKEIMSEGKKGEKGKQDKKKREGGRNNNIEILGSRFSQDQLH